MNFNLSNTQATSSSMPRLKPYEIHRVAFKDIKVERIQGKKDPDAVYEILKVRFENKEGYYEESIFFPKESDLKRPTRQNKEGHEVEMPCNFERTMTFIAQLGTVIAPEEYGKMKGVSFKSFNELCEALIKILKPKIGTETNLKLIGKTDKDGNYVPCLPYFVALNKQGECFTSDNFIGDKVFFSPYEEKRKEEMSKKKPTDMAAKENEIAQEEEKQLEHIPVKRRIIWSSFFHDSKIKRKEELDIQEQAERERLAKEYIYDPSHSEEQAALFLDAAGTEEWTLEDLRTLAAQSDIDSMKILQRKI